MYLTIINRGIEALMQLMLLQLMLSLVYFHMIFYCMATHWTLCYLV